MRYNTDNKVMLKNKSSITRNRKGFGVQGFLLESLYKSNEVFNTNIWSLVLLFLQKPIRSLQIRFLFMKNAKYVDIFEHVK